MEYLNKKPIRSNKAQINFLCHYMAEHPGFAAGDYKSPLGAVKLNTEWRKLKEALDELGPSRSVDQWKICWRDQKRKARDEGGALNRAKNTTGNVVEVPELSGNSALVLSAIGQEMAVGCGPEESPIGFTRATPLSSPRPSTSRPVHAAEIPGNLGMQTPAPRAIQRPVRRARRALPADRFLNAQLELNNLMKELITEIRDNNHDTIREMRRSNELKEEHLNFLRQGRKED